MATFNLFSAMVSAGVKPGSRVKLATGEFNGKNKPKLKQVISSDLPLPTNAKELNRYVSDDMTTIPGSFAKTVASNENGAADLLFRPDGAQIASVIVASGVLGIESESTSKRKSKKETANETANETPTPNERENAIAGALNGEPV